MTTSTNQAQKTSTSQLILRGYWRSSATWRVRIALHYKKIDFTYIPVHLVKEGGEQHSESELKRNSLAQVPTLELTEGGILTQSLAIIDYLEQIKPQPTLYPHSPLDRARCFQMAEIVNSGIQPLQNLALLQRIDQLGADKLAWGKEFIGRGLQALEQVAQQESTGAYLVGDQPTLADLCLIPQLYNARRFKVDLTEYPRLCEVESHCQVLEAFQLAAPEVQIDAQV